MVRMQTSRSPWRTIKISCKKHYFIIFGLTVLINDYVDVAVCLQIVWAVYKYNGWIYTKNIIKGIKKK